MSINYFCVCASGNFAKSSNYINDQGHHPEILSTIGWNQFILLDFSARKPLPLGLG